MKSILVLLTLLVTLAVHAEVLVYKTVFRNTITFQGTTTTTIYGGYIVMNKDNSEMQWIVTLPKARKYTVYSMNDWHGTTAFGSQNKSYTIISQATSRMEDNYLKHEIAFVKGAINPLTGAARSLKMTGYNVYESPYGTEVDEQTATASLDTKTTMDYNAKSLTVQTAVNTLVGNLLNSGYTAM